MTPGLPGRSRAWRATLALAYLLGAGASFLHPLGARAPSACPECGSGPSFIAQCDGPICPDRNHHHHPSRLSHHDSSRCNLCQKHFTVHSTEPAPLGLLNDAAPSRAPRALESPAPGAPTSHPPARAPPKT